MEKFKIIIATVLGAFLALFAIQNMAPVQLTVLLWTFESRRGVVIGISVLVGFVIGWTARALQKRKSVKRPERPESTDLCELPLFPDVEPGRLLGRRVKSYAPALLFEPSHPSLTISSRSKRLGHGPHGGKRRRIIAKQLKGVSL